MQSSSNLKLPLTANWWKDEENTKSEPNTVLQSEPTEVCCHGIY